MSGMHLVHFVVLVAWGLVVVVEAALELGARTDPQRRRVARLHYWIDLLVEIPLLLAVLATGTILLFGAWPPSPLLGLKIGLALIAIGINGYCAIHVILRHRRSDDVRALAHHGRRVLLSGLGAPAALAAAYLGVTYFLR